MKTRVISRNIQRSECGAVLIEALISFLLLISIFLALFDFFTLSSTYVNMSQIAREGVLTAIGDMHFDTPPWAAVTCAGTDYTDMQKDVGTQRYADCMMSGSTELTNTCGHYKVHWRVEMALQAARSTRMDPASISVVTNCSAGTPALYEVRITGMYQGISPFFRNSPMTVRQLGIIR